MRLTQRGFVTTYGDIELGKHFDDLLPDDTKPLP